MRLASEISHLCPGQDDEVEHDEGCEQLPATDRFLQAAECHCRENASHHVERDQTPQSDLDATTSLRGFRTVNNDHSCDAEHDLNNYGDNIAP